MQKVENSTQYAEDISNSLIVVSASKEQLFAVLEVHRYYLRENAKLCNHKTLDDFTKAYRPAVELVSSLYRILELDSYGKFIEQIKTFLR